MATESALNILGQAPESMPCECGTIVKVAGLPPLSTVECPKCHRTFPITVRIGQFLLLKRLGQGAMGEVFEAKDITLGRHVAIKVLGKKVAADEEAMRNFVREARNLAALNHRNVVQVHSIGVERGQPYIVMELVSGGRVDQMVQKDIPGDERRLLEIIVDASRGLEAASNAGLVHGDVKPANILIDTHGQAKIVDFGLARFEESQVENKIYGTPFYLPPELLEGKTADFRSDMYSLGASFFHALAGRPPFKAKTVKDIVRMRLLEAAPNLRTLVPTMHPKTASVVAKMLEKSPDARYVSYAELVADLQLAIREVDAGPVDPALAALHEALSGVDRSASRSGRVAKPEVEAGARSRSHMHGSHRHGHAPAAASKSKVPLIIGAVAVVVVIIIIALVAGGGSGGGGGPVDDPTKRSFADSFEAEKLNNAWQFIDGGGKLLSGIYEVEDRDPAREPGISRTIGGGSCTIDVNISKITWPDSDGAVQVEIMEDAAAGIQIHLWRAQRKSYLELKIIGSNSRSIGRTQFDAAPTSMRLRATWFADTQRWKVLYGINGDPPGPEATGSPASDPAITGTSAGRSLRIKTEHYGSTAPLIMEVSDVAVEFEK